MLKNQITFSADSKNAIRSVREVLQCLLAASRGDEAFYFNLAVHEALSNAIYHGSRNGDNSNIRLVFKELSTGGIIVRIKHYGRGFDGNRLLQSVPKEPEQAARDFCSESGRGLAFILRGCDKVFYNREGTEILLGIKKEDDYGNL